MNAESMFSLAGTLVLPGWLLLVVLPRWQPVTFIATSIVIPVALALLYSWLILTHWAGSGGGFGSLVEVSQLFDNEYLLLAGWVHYLAFDLFIGSWEVRDAQRNGIPHLALIPCLLLTFLFGPAGLLTYLCIRTGVTRRIVPAA